MTDLSLWAKLDPWRALQEIMTISGDATLFDQWSLLDPARAAAQMSEALDVEITQYDLLDPSAALIARVEEALDGGDVPEWVPDNAKIHIDLVNDRAWTEADGIVAIDTLLGSDPNTEEGWNASIYNPANLTVDGYVPTNPPGNAVTPVAFIGAALTTVLDEATVVVRCKDVEDSVGNIGLALMSVDGNDAVEINTSNGTATADSYSGSLNLSIPNIENTGLGAVNCMAVTVTADRFDIAINGSSAVAGVLESDDRPSGNPLVASIVDVKSFRALQSITIYDPLPSTAGLSALSETGVTNTAPHDIAFEWQEATSSIGADATYPEDVVSFALLLANLSATDDEGNPLTWSLTDDGGGKFVVDTVSAVKTLSCLEGLHVDGSPYSGTLRATDPGGLFVEQEFMITVTA